MIFFPAYIKIDNQKILVVGGGKIATDKVGHLLNFTQNIHIIAREISPDMMKYIQQYDLNFETREYKKGDINEFMIVIVAVDDISMQKKIFDEATQKNKLCNSVDSADYCNFIFPAYIKKGDLIVSISTSSTSPALAKHLKTYLSNLIPDDIADFLTYMKNLRASIPKGKEKMKLLNEKAKEYINKWKNR
ncbi:MAG: bifunctional precorrin-2 dehydrogenase/sirohydrochlorin ferrochelatase [Arcobacter sp.]|nr:bifunctional precorrin-2 dehydrogenase/sirohydrochlorin ferrochelatase [Arcobacter sp.]